MNIPQMALYTFYWLIGATIGAGLYILTLALIVTLYQAIKWLLEEETKK